MSFETSGLDFFLGHNFLIVDIAKPRLLDFLLGIFTLLQRKKTWIRFGVTKSDPARTGWLGQCESPIFSMLPNHIVQLIFDFRYGDRKFWKSRFSHVVNQIRPRKTRVPPFVFTLYIDGSVWFERE